MTAALTRHARRPLPGDEAPPVAPYLRIERADGRGTMWVVLRRRTLDEAHAQVELYEKIIASPITWSLVDTTVDPAPVERDS